MEEYFTMIATGGVVLFFLGFVFLMGISMRVQNAEKKKDIEELKSMAKTMKLKYKAELDNVGVLYSELDFFDDKRKRKATNVMSGRLDETLFS